MSKKMFSWIKVLVWKGERMVVSFWWVAESGSRSFTSTSIVVDYLIGLDWKWGAYPNFDGNVIGSLTFL